MKDIEKIKEIFLSEDVDDEDYQENLDKITDWENSLIENENLLSWQEHDITKEIISNTKENLLEVSLRLVNDREITEQERMTMFAKQDAMKWLISLSSDNPKIILEQINDDIKKALNQI